MRKTFILITVVLFPLVCFSATISVPADYLTIQEAIDAAVAGDTVLVAPATYVENIDFLGKAITVKSSDGPAGTTIDGNQAGSVVTFSSGEGLDSVLDGFTITNGSGTYDPTFGYLGGGIYFHASPTIKNNYIQGNSADTNAGISFGDYSSPNITNNIISGNTASKYGGGIGLGDHSSGTITNNIISGNSAILSSGGIGMTGYCSPVIANNVIEANSTGGPGGGIYCHNHSSPTIENNFFMGNSAGGFGGGVACWSFSAPDIANNTFSGNSSDTFGGAISCHLNTSPTISNNMICNNSAPKGGGIDCYDNATATITNNTLYGNSADRGGGIACRNSSSALVTNTILVKNEASDLGPEIYMAGVNSPSTLSISHSDVEGGQSSAHVSPGCTLNWGSGMIDSDSLFVDEVIGDFHLTFNSPCRGSGDNEAVTELTDFEGNPRIAYGTVDMGADEFSTHLYHTGDATSGGNVEVKLIGLPGTSPVFLWVGSGVLGAPIPTKYGDWHLDLPILLTVGLGSIASPEGVSVLPYTFALGFPAIDIPMQSLTGMDLTNLCVMEVK